MKYTTRYICFHDASVMNNLVELTAVKIGNLRQVVLACSRRRTSTIRDKINCVNADATQHYSARRHRVSGRLVQRTSEPRGWLGADIFFRYLLNVTGLSSAQAPP